MLFGQHAVIVYAHRGASAELPENTIEAFARALEVGADALEGDLHASRDGHVVVAHDDDGARMAGLSVPIASCSLEELRRWDVGARFVPRTPAAGPPSVSRGPFRMPTLAELLEAFPSATLNLDVKAPSAISEAIRTIRRASASSRVLLTSFSDATLRAVRAHGYEGPTGLARDEVLRVLALGPLALGPFRPRGRRAQLPARVGPIALARRGVLARLRSLGLAVDFWGVDDASEARRLEALGVDGVMTDDPATIVRALRGAR